MTTSWSARLPRGDALLASTFAWLFASALLARIWRAIGLWQEASAADGFVWLPLGLAADALFACVAVVVVAGAARIARPVALPLALLLGLAHIAWLALNLVSFTLTQAPVTFQRARGDEGVALDAHELLRWQDVVPALAWAGLALALLPAAVVAGRALARRSSELRFRRAVLIGAGACALVYGSDALAFRARNFGVADHPAFTLASSFVLGLLDEARAPQLSWAPPAPMLSSTSSPAQQSRQELLAARTPRQERESPPALQRNEMRNVVVFFAEGVARKHTSLGGLVSTTPNLERRFRQSGLEMSRYYSPYHRSISAIFSLVCSDYPPPNGQNIVEINPRIDCGEVSDVMKPLGMHTALLHGGDFGFYDKLGLLGMRNWDVVEDARSLSDPARYEENEWGIDDRAMVDRLLRFIDDDVPPGDRFAALMIPIAAHWPYWIPSDVDEPLPPLTTKQRFLNAVSFLDVVVEDLMRGLEERGLAQDTAVFVLADHGETVGERPRASPGRRLAYEPSLHVPLVILAPGMWPGGSTSDRLGSHVDLLPTMLDVLGFAPDARHHGTSLLKLDERAQERIFIGAANGPRWVGFLDGDQKLVVNRTTGAREAYDLAADPDERHNLVDDMDPALLDDLEQQALALAELQLAALKSAPRRPDDLALDIEAAFAGVARVRVLERTGGAPAVPLKPTVHHEMKRALAGVDGAAHDCIVVRAPVEGRVLELEAREQPWLPLLSRLRVVQTEPNGSGGGGDDEQPAIEVWSDGELHGRRTLKTKGHVRMSFAAPRESLVLRVMSERPSTRDICITLTERGWRPAQAQAGTPRGTPE